MPQQLTSELFICLVTNRLQAQPVGEPLICAIDGRCGSGKTTFAKKLSKQFPDSLVIHTDDFYLPLSKRVPGWETIPCANMDLARLRDDTMSRAYTGHPVPYQPYSCRDGVYLPAQLFPARALVILEGSYSHHPMLTPYETIRVFLTCSQQTQARRLQLREGARFSAFATRWIPLEEAYFSRYKIEQTTDYIIHTDSAES